MSFLCKQSVKLKSNKLLCLKSVYIKPTLLRINILPVFISHSHEDEAIYSSLCIALDASGICRWSPEELSLGERIADGLKAAIEECSKCIFIATARSINSIWCLAELGAFWGANKKVFVYLADPTIEEKDIPKQFQGNLWTNNTKKLIASITNERNKMGAYGFLEGVWHEYHFTFDPSLSKGNISIAHTEIKFSISDDHSISGRGKFVASHRPVYGHRYKGGIRGGTLFYTALCNEIPGDIYSAVYSNLFNRPFVGAITGLDYANKEFSSPIILSEKLMSEIEAAEALKNANVEYYCPEVYQPNA